MIILYESYKTIKGDNMEQDKLILGAKEAAKLLGIGKMQLLKMAENGTIKSFNTPGGQIRFTRIAIDDFIRRMSEG